MFGIWLAIFCILTIIEIMTVDFVTIWFAIGSFCTAFVALFTDSLWIQLPIFFTISIISIILTRPLKTKIDQQRTATNLDRIIGMTGIVTEDIKKDSLGEVKVDGKLWAAMSDENKEMKKGTKVEILSINSTKLKVKEKRSEK